MKRLLIVIVAMFIILCDVYAATSYPSEYRERVWAYNGEQATTFDLSNTFYLPTYAVEWSAYSNNLVDGTYITKPQNGKVANGIGHFGVSSGCEHMITFAVSTDGKFVSQSDPTKYRDFYVALKPRIREYQGPYVDSETGASGGSGNITTGADKNYYIDASTGLEVNHSDRVPNTRLSSTIYVYSPPMKNLYDLERGAIVKSPDKLVNAGGSAGYIYPARVYWDVLLGFDPITSQDKIHLADLDDYIARVYISWSCDHPGCENPEHTGSFVFTVRGQYNTTGNESDNVFVIVTPDAAASRLDLVGMINENTGIGTEKIATLNILTTNPNNNPKWDTHVMVFLSASPNYNSVNSEGFVLKRYFPSPNPETDIPFTIKVYNEGYEGVTVNRSYDGKMAFTSYSADKNKCINFSGKIKELHGNELVEVNIIHNYNERSGKASSGLIYNGSVFIEIDDTDRSIRDNIEEYAGIYKGYIYYHVVYAN